jgi:hypothetical protein
MIRSMGPRIPLVPIAFLILISASPRIASAQLSSVFAEQPMVFEQNEGQVSEVYRFMARRSGMVTLYLSGGMDVFVPKSESSIGRFQLRWDRANTEAPILGENALPGHSNYFRGSDEARWLRDIPQFGRLRYSQLYAGIDLLFYGHGGELENDFIIAPRADPSQIAFRIDRPVQLGPSGDLEVILGNSVVTLQKPISYQIAGIMRENVPIHFVLAEDGQVRFQVGDYDHDRPLVIDPVLGFSTYLAGTGTDQIGAVTTDPDGNVYVTGYTTSSDFPLQNPEQPTCGSCTDTAQDPDVYVSKLDPTGHTLLYSTYVGSPLADRAQSIAIDKAGNIIVAGVSDSNSFPHAGSINSPTCQINHFCFFVFSLKPDGSAFNYSGLVGGEEGTFTNGKDGLVAVDPSGNAYLTGQTYDQHFQLTSGTLGPTFSGFPLEATFVLKLGPTGTLLYSTVIPGNATQTPGGNVFTNNFPAGGILVDAGGQVTLAGLAGPGLLTTPGVFQPSFPNDGTDINAQAGYLLQLNVQASALNFATYLKGTDSATGLAVDASGNFYVTGTTSELNLPVSANAYQKTIVPGGSCTCDSGYITKLDSQGKSLLAATYLSGTPLPGNEGTSLLGIVLDSKSNVFLGGTTASADFPLKNPLVSTLQTTTTVGGLVLAELNPDLSALLFGSFLGSQAIFGGSTFTGLTMDPHDNAIVVGETLAIDFPTTPNGFQPVLPPAKSPFTTPPHGFISKLDLATPAPSVCLSNVGVDFGTVLVNSPSTQTLQITNCGNAPLQVSSAISSLSVFSISESCGAVAPGASCGVQIRFTPVDTSVSLATLKLTDNAAVPSQAVTLSGTGGVPQVFYPPAFNANDLLVGTNATFVLLLSNTGTANWIINSVGANSDFSASNTCTTPVPPTGSCALKITFAPSQPGVRTGTLTIIDNVAGSPHAIPLSGNGLTTYPTPTITSIPAFSADQPDLLLRIFGTNFFPASQVIVNGSIRTTHYLSETELGAELTASDLSKETELPATVVNSLPGGGLSNTSSVTIYDAIRNIEILHTVYSANSGLLYSSISTMSPTNANKIGVVDPSTAKLVNVWSVGNGPNQLAISDDGQFLYVGLDGDKKVAQVAVATGVVNFTVGLGNDPDFNNPMIADAIRVLPGQAHSWAVTLCGVGFIACGEGVAVFDDAVQRPTRVFQSQVEPDGLLFVGTNAATLYGTTLFQAPSTFYGFSINSMGVTEAQEVTNFAGESPGGGFLDSDGKSIYVANGQVIDPSTLAITSHIPGVSNASGLRVDAPASRVYFVGEALGSSQPNTGDFVIDALISPNSNS